MAIASTYNTGTASISAASTAVTGQGTTWLTSGLQAGDLFWAAGLAVRIAAVVDNTHLTLAYAWPGATRATDTYEVRFTPDATRVLASARELIDMLGNGAVAALAAVGSAANKLAYYTGTGVAALADITAHARAFLALSGGAGKFPRSTGTNTIVLQDIVGTVAQASGIPTGSIIERGSNANGEYVRFADGTQICWTAASEITSGAVTTASGPVFTSANVVWIFPAAFSAAPQVSGGKTSASSRWLTVVSVGTTNATIRVFSSVTIATDLAIGAIAIGRWF